MICKECKRERPVEQFGLVNKGMNRLKVCKACWGSRNRARAAKAYAKKKEILQRSKELTKENCEDCIHNNTKDNQLLPFKCGECSLFYTSWFEKK